MNFVALDFETANPRLSSICQIGATRFQDGEPVETLCRYVQPNDYFHPINISVHGIDEATVAGAPTFAEAHQELHDLIGDKVVVTHTGFDRTAMHRACEIHSLPAALCQWLDSSMIVRRAWPQFARSGYGLANIASFLDLTFKHHDAGEDSRVTGQIVVQAIRETGFGVEDWLIRVRQPISPSSASLIAQSGDQSGPLAGEVIVFTGALMLPRREAAKMAAEAGIDVADGVTKHTTLLVVGDQDLERLADGETKSSKHRKAECLIKGGQSLRILSEADFQALIDIRISA
jgi:DNA polymerase-3 subunit epsilon